MSDEDLFSNPWVLTSEDVEVLDPEREASFIAEAAALEELDRLFTSPEWPAFFAELQGLESEALHLLVNKAASVEELYAYRGRTRVLRHLLAMPERTIERLRAIRAEQGERKE
ncbi:MAG: hypothetical protein ACT4PO_14365 [Actinomycetota bacterium]